MYVPPGKFYLYFTTFFEEKRKKEPFISFDQTALLHIHLVHLLPYAGRV